MKYSFNVYSVSNIEDLIYSGEFELSGADRPKLAIACHAVFYACSRLWGRYASGISDLKLKESDNGRIEFEFTPLRDVPRIACCGSRLRFIELERLFISVWATF